MALAGMRVLELAGLAPSTFAGVILADFGASVIRIDRTGIENETDCLGRGKRSIALDLKSHRGLQIAKRLSSRSDVLIEPFRPGVMEKLGLGPEILLQENRQLIYARLSGYGQTGSLANVAGHDINYLAISGLLSVLGRRDEKPTPPVNILADFAGGGLLCAFGILAALIERYKSGKGQVIDANLTEGASYVGSWIFASQKLRVLDYPFWGKERGNNFLDTGFPLYDTYETSDGQYMSVGALEPQFAAEFLKGLGLDISNLGQPVDSLRRKITEIFKTKTRAEWTEHFKDADACVQPVLSMDEAPHHEHHVERRAYQKASRDLWAPVPAPRLSRSPGHIGSSDPQSGEHSRDILTEIGYSKLEIDTLINEGIVEQYYSASSKL